MVAVDLQRQRRFGARGVRHFRQHLFHFERQRALAGQADRILLQLAGKADGVHRAVERVFHKVEHRLRVLVFLGDLRFFLVRLQVEVGRADVGKRLAVVFAQHLDGKFVHIVGAVEHLEALGLHTLRLRQHIDLVDRFARGVVDRLLVLTHTGDVFLKRNHLLFARRIEQQQILQRLLVDAEAVVYAEFELQPEGLEEFFIGFAVVLQQLFQFALDLLFKVLRNDLEQMILLQGFTGDVQRQVGGIHQPLDKAEIVGQQIGAFVHDQHAVGIKLQTLFKLLGVIVIRRVRRDIQQRIVADLTLGFGMDRVQRRLVVIEL